MLHEQHGYILSLSIFSHKPYFQIDYNGTVGFYTSTVSSVICQLDVFKFPMDQHECGVTVLFHNYFNDEYKIHGEMEAMAKPMSQLGNGEWKVTYIGVAEQSSSNPSLSSIQRFVARIERNPGFYVSLVMVPAYFINLLTIIALFMDIENVGEKISVGLTNIMAMTFILVILAADLPKTARIPLLVFNIPEKMSRIHIIIYCFALILSTTDSQSMSAEQMANYKRFLANQEKLFDKLFKTYDPGQNAVYTLYHLPESNVTIHPPRFEIVVQLSMLKLVEVVEPEEKATFLFDYQSNWYDPRLSWDPEEYGGINHIYVPRSRVWIPETTIVDCSEVKVFDNEYTRYVWVYNFPLDRHTCSVNLLFNTYRLEEFLITGKTGTMPRPVNQLGNGEWQMNSIQMSIEPVVDNMTYLTRFEATFQRNPGFYVVLVMIPAYFINFLSIVALFTDIDNRNEKFTVAMTNIMSMSFILVILAEDLPKTKNLPILAIYTVTSLAIMLFSLAAVILLPKLKLYYANRRLSRGEKIPKNDEVPRTCWERIKFYFKVEYVFMAVFQIANFVNFVIIFV
ncbi:hypothetical protein B9Z55_017557 [Caenorhabditis nigoni]|uniref:Neurotransmitter-gated ion-channel ligand-binding domain-containing protein n=1 Tax=Caenorhabditis nigoni TaxID=1611254 RepID=A0A2G5TA03_9PELO|nr:hypothetical protein B9Z55_017557 [Caenorhabditis nigoni]